ncbi:MAG: DUF1028 domain-containing protein [Planctomycetota bacterium]|jgi:hypothetical protein
MRSRAVLALVLAMLTAAPARGTWSIVIADEETGEVAVGTVTCLTSFDLRAIVPVVVVGAGGAAVQAAGDFDGIRRPVIFEQLALGTPPEDILALLAGIGGHQSRQYGIVDTAGGAISFTGASNGAWAGGTTGRDGTIRYAVQGNVLAGACVIDAIVASITDPGDDIPRRLMDGMRAAQLAGGDGRCSCSSFDPPGCGCPPPPFAKSGHIGCMIVARTGDTDDDVCNASGCADGDYFMDLNVAFQGTGAPDAVTQLQLQYNSWRGAHVGRPDAVHSTVTFPPGTVPPNGVSTTTMTVALRDWLDDPVPAGITSLTVAHAPGSDGHSTIGAVVDQGDGTYEIVLTAGTAPGVDRFRVTADDGIRPVLLTPDATLTYFALGDVDGDGDVDFGDILALIAQWGDCAPPPAPCPADLNGDGTVGFADVLVLIANWT